MKMKKLLVPDGWVDVINRKIIKNGKIIVDKEKIISTDPGERIDCIERFELKGILLFPGFIDLHVHLRRDGSFSKNQEKGEELFVKLLKNYSNVGIAAIREAGGKHNEGIIAKRLYNNDHSLPLIFPAGMAIYKKGFYGDFLGAGVSTKDEMIKHIDIIKRKGAKILKIIVSGVASFDEYGKIEGGKQGFSREEIRFLVNQAKKRGLSVMAHANGKEAIIDAIMAGVDSIEHGIFITKEVLEKMAKSLTVWVPTLVALWANINNPKLNQKQKDVVKRIFDTHIKAVSEGINIGVKIGTGTDSGSPGVIHGKAFTQELKFLHDAGLKGFSLLESATLLPAKLLNAEDKIGSIARNKYAKFSYFNGKFKDWPLIF